MDPSEEPQGQSSHAHEFNNCPDIATVNQDNEQHAESCSKQMALSEIQDFKSEDSQFEVIGENSDASTSKLECEAMPTTVGCLKEPSQIALNDVGSADNPRKSAVLSPELLEEQVTKLNITGGEPSSEVNVAESCSQVVVNKETDSLKSLMTYDGASDSDDSEIENSNEDVEPNHVNNKEKSENSWRNGKDLSDSSDSESDSAASTLSSESDSDSNDNSEAVFNNSDRESVIDASSDDGIIDEVRVSSPVRDRGAVRKTSKAVVTENNFPPIPDLSMININPDEEFIHMGRVIAIIGNLVTVESLPGIPAFDLDSMLFISDDIYKKPLGPIFDVLGPVTEPIYCVRFNSEDEIKTRGVLSGLKVFAAPKSEEFSKFVFVNELLKMKGTDASWLNDQEQPVEMLELSDDEDEHQIRRSGNTKDKRKLLDNSVERHRRYERTMNHCNTLNTKVCKLMDVHKNMPRPGRPNSRAVNQPQGLSPVPPQFNPTVPPPGFGHSSPFGYIGQARPVPTSHPVFVQSPGFVGPYLHSNFGPPVIFNGPMQFGNVYRSVTPPTFVSQPPRWPHWDTFMLQPPENLQNQDNCFTNNSRNSNGRDPGPSSQS